MPAQPHTTRPPGTPCFLAETYPEGGKLVAVYTYTTSEICNLFDLGLFIVIEEVQARYKAAEVTCELCVWLEAHSAIR